MRGEMSAWLLLLFVLAALGVVGEMDYQDYVACHAQEQITIAGR